MSEIVIMLHHNTLTLFDCQISIRRHMLAPRLSYLDLPPNKVESYNLFKSLFWDSKTHNLHYTCMEETSVESTKQFFLLVHVVYYCHRVLLTNHFNNLGPIFN